MTCKNCLTGISSWDVLTTTVATTAAGCPTKNGRVDLEHRHRLSHTFSTRVQGMTSTHSSRKSRGDKPAKPRDDYQRRADEVQSENDAGLGSAA
jgi:hypothetical protein